MQKAEEPHKFLKECLDGNPVPTFILNADHTILHWNRACETIIGKTAQEMVGTRHQWSAFYPSSPTPRPTLADLIIDGVDDTNSQQWYANKLCRSNIVENAYEALDFFPHIQPSGRWLLFTASPIHHESGTLIGAIETLVDVTEMKNIEQELMHSQQDLEKQVLHKTMQLNIAQKDLEKDIEQRKLIEAELKERNTNLMDLNQKLTHLNEQLSAANEQIKMTHHQLIQQEKMASIGQLSAGIAHEINNPMSYVFSNFRTLDHYFLKLINIVNQYVKTEELISDVTAREALKQLRESVDLDFMCHDILVLMYESCEGIERVSQIVKSLKEFSHIDAVPEWQLTDILRGLHSTLNIANNEIKYRADIVMELSVLPEIQCLPSEINQVFMNLLINAAHAIDTAARGTITLRSGYSQQEVWVEIEDTGSGMSEDVKKRIFDPFFTTKPVGKGTGLGLSLSYSIIQKHHGSIEVRSEIGVGTCFRVTLPINQPEFQQETAYE
ncbi:MAG: ATP-binding protein [Pseudomonadota bacterium]